MDSWVCVFVKTLYYSAICSQEFDLTNTRIYAHILYTLANARINLLQPLCSQIGVNTHKKDLFQTFFLSPTTLSSTNMSSESFVLIVFTVLPIKPESMMTTNRLMLPDDFTPRKLRICDFY